MHRYCGQYIDSDEVESLVEKAVGFIDEGLSESNKSLSNSMKWKLKDMKKQLKAIRSGNVS